MISALTNQGLLRFEFHDGSVNSERFIDFMGDLIHDEQSKVFLIVDNLRAHKSRSVQNWLAAHNKEIELFYLPPYSPELNPDELINRDLKTELRTRPASSNRGTLRRLARDFMQKLQGMPQRVANYFRGSRLAYAGIQNGACTV